MKDHPLTAAFLRCKERLHRSASRYIGSDDADDALQEAFVRLWRRRDRIYTDAEAEGMMSTTVRNICIDEVRHSTSYQQVDIDTARTADIADEEAARKTEVADIYADVSRLIEASLSERDRRILYSRDRDGMEIEDIAEAEEITETNVRVILSRARKTIRSIYLQKYRQ